MKKVLIPIDETARSLANLRSAVRHAAGGIYLIELVNVQPLLSQHIARWIPRHARDAWRAERSAAALAPARRILEGGPIPWREHTVAGPREATIAAMARELRCDEIIAPPPPPRFERVAVPAGLGLIALLFFADQ